MHWATLFAVTLLAAPSHAFLCRTAARWAVHKTSLWAEKEKEEEYRTTSRAQEALKYYSGLVNDPITDLQLNEEQAKRDNLTPNLRLAGIFIVILGVLFNAFLQANVDTAPFSP
jgi:hypothetical protein